MGIIVGLTIAAAMVVPSAALAEENRLTRGRPWQCMQNSTGWYCLYDHVNFNRGIFDETGYVFMGWYCGVYDMPQAFWDRATSWTNRQYAGARVSVNSWRIRPDYEHLWRTPVPNSEDNQVEGWQTDKADWTANNC
jgi:hypothetical protein